MTFGIIDSIIVVVYLASTVVIGVFTHRYIRGVADYLVAGRGLGTYVAVATMISTGLGLVTVMYFSEEGYKNGFSPFIVGLIIAFGYFVIGKTGFIMAPLRRLRVMTAPEFYELKYTRGVRILGGAILGLAGTLNMGLFPILGSKFIIGITGIPLEYVNITMTVLIVIVLIYTVLGGMVSVVLTDFVQFLMLSIGLVGGTYFVFAKVGWGNIISTIQTNMGDGGFSPIVNEDFGWMWLVYMLSVCLIGCVWQPEASRAYSSESPRVVKRVYLISGLMLVGRATIPMFWGAAALAYLGPGKDAAWAMPHMMSQILPVGLLGIVAAGMLAAFMSTHDSYLLAWSSVIVRDVISPIAAIRQSRRSGESEVPQDAGEDATAGGLTGKQAVFWTRVVVVLLAAFLLFWGIWYMDKLPVTAFKYMYITGTIYFSGVLGALVCGLYWKRANTVGAYCSLILGALAPIGFIVLTIFEKQLPDWSWLRAITKVNTAGMLSLLMGGLGMVVGSLLTQKSCPPKPVVYPEDTD